MRKVQAIRTSCGSTVTHIVKLMRRPRELHNDDHGDNDDDDENNTTLNQQRRRWS